MTRLKKRLGLPIRTQILRRKRAGSFWGVRLSGCLRLCVSGQNQLLESLSSKRTCLWSKRLRGPRRKRLLRPCSLFSKTLSGATISAI